MSCTQEEENENDEMDAENQEGKLAWRGGRAEEATYEAEDGDDAAAAAAARAQAALQAGDPVVGPCCSSHEIERHLWQHAITY